MDLETCKVAHALSKHAVLLRQAVAQVRAGGACRCVKWAGGGADLLACSEHESIVHIIDARTWSSQARPWCRPQAPSPPKNVDRHAVGALRPRVAAAMHVH